MPKSSPSSTRRPATRRETHVETTVHGRYLVETPDAGSRLLLMGYHGYGERAEVQMGRLRRIAGSDRWLLASVQALHPFYVRSDRIGANWMTSEHRDQAIAENLAYVAAVQAALARAHGVDAVVHAGFSQGAGMAFRAALAGGPAAAVIACGGDVPPELRTRAAAEWNGLRVVLARGTDDTYYTASKLDEDVSLLKARPVRLHTVVFDGGHEWSQQVCDAAAAVLDDIAAQHA